MNREARIISLLGLLVFTLAGCGFHSVYGPYQRDDGSPVAVQMNQISIDNIADRTGQILRNDLIDKIYGKGRPARPLYSLTTKIHVSEEDLGIQLDATTTRTLMNMYADYELKDAGGKVILHGAAHSVTSFSKLADQYGTLAAREDALQRTLDEVSEQMVNRLSLYFAERP